MKIITIKHMIRRELPIYYRRLYTGLAVIEQNAKNAEKRIDFAIEQLPTGQKIITFSFLDPVDFPLASISDDMKKHIATMDQNDALPE